MKYKRPQWWHAIRLDKTITTLIGMTPNMKMSVHLLINLSIVSADSPTLAKVGITLTQAGINGCLGWLKRAGSLLFSATTIPFRMIAYPLTMFGRKNGMSIRMRRRFFRSRLPVNCNRTIRARYFSKEPEAVLQSLARCAVLSIPC